MLAMLRTLSPVVVVKSAVVYNDLEDFVKVLVFKFKIFIFFPNLCKNSKLNTDITE